MPIATREERHSSAAQRALAPRVTEDAMRVSDEYAREEWPRIAEDPPGEPSPVADSQPADAPQEKPLGETLGRVVEASRRVLFDRYRPLPFGNRASAARTAESLICDRFSASG
jgi:hypothetical protein